MAYGRVLFGGAAAIWLANMCASILRGTGNMLAPGVVMTVLLTLSIPLSGALTLGWFGLLALAVRGPAAAFVTIYVVAGIVMGGYVLSGRAGLRLRWSGLRLRADLAGDILRVGLFGCANSTLTIITVIVVTAMVGRHGTAALAGYGLGSRLGTGKHEPATGCGFGARGHRHRCRVAIGPCRGRAAELVVRVRCRRPDRVRCGRSLGGEVWAGMES